MDAGAWFQNCDCSNVPCELASCLFMAIGLLCETWNPLSNCCDRHPCTIIILNLMKYTRMRGIVRFMEEEVGLPPQHNDFASKLHISDLNRIFSWVCWAEVEICAGAALYTSAMTSCGFQGKRFDAAWPGFDVHLCLQRCRVLQILAQIRYSRNHNLLRTVGFLAVLGAETWAQEYLRKSLENVDPLLVSSPA